MAPILIHHDLVLTTYIYKEPISKQRHILILGEQELDGGALLNPVHWATKVFSFEKWNYHHHLLLGCAVKFK